MEKAQFQVVIDFNFRSLIMVVRGVTVIRLNEFDKPENKPLNKSSNCFYVTYFKSQINLLLPHIYHRPNNFCFPVIIQNLII